MNPITSTASARGLLPTWPGAREKESDPDDGHGLLRPITRETGSRWGSESTTGLGTGSRKGSILDEIDQNNHLGLIRRQEVRSLDDLEQELSDSTSTLFKDFERETIRLDHDIRKQIGELKEFQPQMRRIEALEERMRAGRTRAEALSGRLEEMREEIDRWEKKEAECQIRISRRLRIIWAVVAAGIVTLAVALIIQNWIAVESHDIDFHSKAAAVTNTSTQALVDEQDSGRHLLASNDHEDEYMRSLYPSKLISRHNTRQSTGLATATSANLDEFTRPSGQDPLKIFDEL
ncbi:hypothetical protein BBP40_000302 [Aspergillus hancockii]|nr:hypothetical protein BBP40_000302 [Aspergillus hancockii]